MCKTPKKAETHFKNLISGKDTKDSILIFYLYLEEQSGGLKFK